MVQGWLAEKKIWFSSIYGSVVCGSPWLCCLLHQLIRVVFLLYSMGICTCYYADLMFVMSLLVIRLCVGYKHGFAMYSSYVFFRIISTWWLTNAWANKCYCSYYERELDILGDSQISFRILCSNMHSWPVYYMFTICLMKWSSWLDLVRSSTWSSFVCLALYSSILSFQKALGSFV